VGAETGRRARLRGPRGARGLIAAAARGALLAGPVVLAFSTGGYTDGARTWAGVVAWALAAVALLVGEPPRGRAAWLAIGGLAAYTAWVFLSTAWAPIAGPAWETGQIAAVYVGALVATTYLLPGAVRWVEPALAAGALVVVGYGLSERLLPALLTFERSVTAQGRLEQPLTYWNGMGVTAAFGIVLCARLAGDPARARLGRMAAAAAAAPLGLGLSLAVSRGALYACAAGLLTLVVIARRREQLQAILLVLGVGGLAALAAAPFDGVSRLAGSEADRVREGAMVLVALIAAGALAALVQRLGGAAGRLRLPRHAGALALALVVAGFVVAMVTGGDERSTRTLGPGADRLVSLTSNRYEYWKVAGRAFADQPLRGVGAGGWEVRWRAERPFPEGARDAHSLYFETAAELGLAGLLLLGLALAGVVLAARTAVRVAPEVAAGPVAVCAVWAAHVALDWDFELPAVTLPAVIAAGALFAAAPLGPPAPAPVRG
jgi:hypothetical protein